MLQIAAARVIPTLAAAAIGHTLTGRATRRQIVAVVIIVIIAEIGIVIIVVVDIVDRLLFGLHEELGQGPVIGGTHVLVT